MADGKDLHLALEASRLRLSPVEEMIVFGAMTDLDKRIQKFLTMRNDKEEAREPYEFG